MVAGRLAIAMTVGLAISASCTYVLSRKISAAASAPAPEQKYVAPSRAIKPGEVLKPEMLQLLSWPAKTPIPDGYSKMEVVVGRSVLYPIAKGQPITEQYLTVVGSGPGLAGKIPSGMRAIALRTDEVVGVAGFLLPDSRVDVLATVHTGNSPDPMTFVALQNAQVLAAGHQIEPDPEGKPATVTVVTLLLSPKDAERAVLASLQGTIHFVLRNGSDKDEPGTSSLDLSQLVNASAKSATVTRHAVPHLEVAKPKPVEPFTVETIAGDKQSLETFRGGAF